MDCRTRCLEIRGPAFDYLHALIVVVFGRNEWGSASSILRGAVGVGSCGALLCRLRNMAARASAVLFLLVRRARLWSTHSRTAGRGPSNRSDRAAGVGDRRVTLWRVAFAGALIVAVRHKPTYASSSCFAVVCLLSATVACVGCCRGGRPRAAVRAPISCVGGLLPPERSTTSSRCMYVDDVGVFRRGPAWSRVFRPRCLAPKSKFAVALGVSAGGLLFLPYRRTTPFSSARGWVSAC